MGFGIGCSQDTTGIPLDKKIRIAAIPYFNYSRTIDFSFGLITTGFYKVDLNDSISPVTSTAVVEIYATSGSYVARATQQFYLKEDTWRARFAVGSGTGNLQFYEDFCEGSQIMDYSTSMPQSGRVTGLKIFPKLNYNQQLQTFRLRARGAI